MSTHRPSFAQEFHNEEVALIPTRKRLGVLLSEFVAELLGTFLLATFGGGVAVRTARSQDALVANALGISMGLAMAVCVSGQISGGHVNPAITTSLAVFRKFPWRKVPVYILAQTIGALMAAVAVTLFNYPAIAELDRASRLALFASSPVNDNYLLTFTNICSGAVLLLIGVMSLTDKRNRCPPWFFPFGLIVIQSLICMILPGYPLNPAWDFGFRLFAMPITQSPAFDAKYFLIPLTAPVVGGLLGTAIYDLLLA